ncbi:CBS domain-containing protein [Paludibacterium purpuratum]|uniref:CBS domain-containing protein n=1 Tax=Paludibacterium purpuratum TaxID=1144873 RepID=A0A4R7B411_9NEIS|nr:CBS domain-containing protein [Paludibacterium purpuratum]TDR76725.1 CBS domain-containing protein [Paludibacterium purpuratum]
MDKALATLVVPSEARLIDAVQVIKENRSRCAIVVSRDKVIGVISEGDVMRALLHGADLHSPLEGWVSLSFKFLREPNYVEALELAKTHGISLIPILDQAFHLTGVITLNDVLNQVIIAPK